MAERHINAGQVSGKPIRMLLVFDGGKSLRLHCAANGAEMIADGRPLEPPIDMGEHGRTDIADVTQSLFPALLNLEIAHISALDQDGRCVGIKLDAGSDMLFYFWNDGDEFCWGDESGFIAHPWLDGIAPIEAGLIQI